MLLMFGLLTLFFLPQVNSTVNLAIIVYFVEYMASCRSHFKALRQKQRSVGVCHVSHVIRKIYSLLFTVWS